MRSTIDVQGHGLVEFDPTSHNSVLEALELAGVDINSMCKDGYCGSCKATLIEGSVVYHIEPMISKSGGEFFPCSCKPAVKSMKISI